MSIAASPPLVALVGAALPRYRTATEYVEGTLRQGILSGVLPGGMALRQEELATTFGVSRQPVREALRQLEAQALIDFFPHRGAVVTEISAADAADHYAIRAALEPAALRLSLPLLEPSDLAAARGIVAEMDAEPDQSRLGELNRRFHMALYAKAGRPRLLALVDQHLASADRYLRFHLAAFGRSHLSQSEHRALVEACRRRAVDRAVAILTRHITAAGDHLQAFLAAR